MTDELPETTEEAMRSRATIIICGALLAVSAAAHAMPADWHGGRHPQPVADASFARPVDAGPRAAGQGTLETGAAGSWRGLATAAEVAGRVLKAAFACEIEGTGDGRGVTRSLAACVMRTGMLAFRGTPLPRAAAGVAAEVLLDAGRGLSGGSDAGAAEDGSTAADEGDRCCGAASSEGRR